jgi:hypothetical protein
VRPNKCRECGKSIIPSANRMGRGDLRHICRPCLRVVKMTAFRNRGACHE